MSNISAVPFACRPGCAACCIAPSISTPIPGHPQGKAANIPCIQLDEQGYCRLFQHPSRPTVFQSLQPSLEMCGYTRQDALITLQQLERDTCPSAYPHTAAKLF